MPNLIDRSWAIRGTDGVWLRISETPDRFEVVVAVERDDKIETVRLNREQWEAVGTVSNKYGRGDGPEVNDPPTETMAREETAARAEANGDGELHG